MKLRFTPRAAQDIEEIAAYIRTENAAAALRVRAAILDALRAIADFPKLGRKQSVETVRKIVARKFPYIIYYRFDETAGEVVILTICHPARDRPLADG